jgi:polar amino acid transport system substrate-binding protein
MSVLLALLGRLKAIDKEKTMKKVCRWWLVLCCIVVGSVQAQTITGRQDVVPPFTQKDKANPGLSVEITRAAFESQGHSLKVRLVDWPEAMKVVKDAEVDILLGAWYTSERSVLFKFSKHYYLNKMKLIHLKGTDFEYNGFTSLQDKKIAVIEDYGYSEEFSSSTLFTRVVGRNLAENLKKLQRGEVDLVIADEQVAQHEIRNNNFKASNFVFSKKNIFVNPLHICTSYRNKKHKILIRDFNRGLKAIKADGTYAKIIEKYQ